MTWNFDSVMQNAWDKHSAIRRVGIYMWINLLINVMHRWVFVIVQEENERLKKQLSGDIDMTATAQMTPQGKAHYLGLFSLDKVT